MADVDDKVAAAKQELDDSMKAMRDAQTAFSTARAEQAREASDARVATVRAAALESAAAARADANAKAVAAAKLKK